MKPYTTTVYTTDGVKVFEHSTESGAVGHAQWLIEQYQQMVLVHDTRTQDLVRVVIP